MKIREIEESDLVGLLELYQQLHNNSMPELTEELELLWKQILSDRNHHIIIGVEEGVIISSCVLVIIPNLTHLQRPYAFIENVITEENLRGRGYASQLLSYAKEIAVQNNCYKIMLMTGSKEDSTLNFYEKAGYNQTDKTAFIQWL